MDTYDGSWANDPLDIRCIRLDAEMEEMAENPRPKHKVHPAPEDEDPEVTFIEIYGDELQAIEDHKDKCSSCSYGKGSEECLNCFIGGY